MVDGKMRLLSSALLLCALVAAGDDAVPLDLVVMLEAPGGSRGAGIIFKKQGQRLFVVTADHVVRKESKVPIEDVLVYTHFAPGVANPGKVVRRDRPLDLAVIEIDRMTTVDSGQIPFAVLGDMNEFRERSSEAEVRASVVGWYADEKWNHRVEPVKPMTGNLVNVYSPDAISTGSSGGAIFDDRQQLIGLMQEYLTKEKIARGRSIAAVIAWLKESHPVALRPRPAVPLGWVDVFADDLKSADATKKLLLVHGQYTGGQGFTPRVRRGLWMGGGHMFSAAWPDCAVTPPFGVSFEFAVENLESGARPVLWLRGPGYGASRSAAIVLMIEAGRQLLIQHGETHLAAPVQLPEVLDLGDWYHLDVLVEADRIRIGFQGQEVGTYSYVSAGKFDGPLHAFVGLGAFQGITGSNFAVAYRNLEIRKPAATNVGCDDIARDLQPRVTSTETAEGSVVFDAVFPGADIGRIATASPAAVADTSGGLTLYGINALPVVWLERTIQGDFDVDVEMSYPLVGDSVNFHLLLARADHKTDENAWPLVPGPGWAIAFPNGDGNVSIRQFPAQVSDLWAIASSPVAVQQTPFYAPVNGRPYHLRLLRRGALLRVFSNGGLLFSTPFPRDGEVATPYYLGIGQIFGQSFVHRIKAVALTAAAE